MRVRATALWMLGVATLTGCVAYRPQPLTERAIGEALKPADPDRLRTDAALFHHPALPPVTVDITDGVSPDEAAVIAVLANPGLRAERDRLALADAQVLQARILPNPQLSYAHDIPVGGTPDATTAFSAGLAMEINEILTRRSRVGAARADRASVVLDVAWREWQVAEAAKTAVYGLAALQERQRLATEAAARIDENVALVRRAVGAGQLTAADLAAAEAARKDAQSNLLETEAAAASQRIGLNSLLGAPGASPIALQAGVELPARVEPLPESELVDHLEDHRLDLRALREGYASQEATLHAAVLAQFPRLSVGFTRARDTSDVTTNGFAVTIDLPVFDRNQGPIAAATATRQQLFDEYTFRVFEARSEIAGAVADIRSLDAQVEAAGSAEAAFRDLEQTYRTALEQSQVDVLDYVTAANSYQSARIQTLVLREQLLEARVRLEIASGLYTVERGTGSLSSRPAKQDGAE